MKIMIDEIITQLLIIHEIPVIDALVNEICFRTEELDDRGGHIIACIRYIKDNGIDAIFTEEDDGNIWEYYKEEI